MLNQDSICFVVHSENECICTMKKRSNELIEKYKSICEKSYLNQAVVLLLDGSYQLKYTVMKSNSRHIFEKLLICIERGIYCVNIKEMNIFENFIF